MATKKVKNGKSPNYNCEAFQIISDGIKSALEMSEYTSETLSNNALPQILANKAFGVLISEKIITKHGKPNSESRYTYITGVLPFFGQQELQVLEKNPKTFADRFCLHTFRKDEKSLALLLYQNEDPLRVFGMDRKWIKGNLQVFEEFREFTKEDEEDSGLSPFECVDPSILEDFLSTESPSQLY